MILPIYTVPQPILTGKAEKVTTITPDIKQLVLDMQETMHNAQGVGIAAPQVGFSVALCLVELRASEDRGEAIPFTVFINPRITWKSLSTETDTEACLSIPGVEGAVKRATKIRVKAQNLEGKPFEITAKDFLARILQHEIDHLNGVLFTSYLPKQKLLKRPIVDYPRI